MLDFVFICAFKLHLVTAVVHVQKGLTASEFTALWRYRNVCIIIIIIIIIITCLWLGRHPVENSGNARAQLPQKCCQNELM